MHRGVMVDTGVILDMAMQVRPGHVSALQLLHEIEMGSTKVFLCAASLRDVYYVLTKYMGETDARLCVRALMDVMEICAIDKDVSLQAVGSDEPDFEDGPVRACAENRGVNYLISRDESAFMRSPVKRLSAAEYIEREGMWTEVGL